MTDDFSMYASCNRKRREYIFNLLAENDNISSDKQHALAQQFGCTWQTIYYDICLFKAGYDDHAFNVVLKKKWSAQNQRAKRYGVHNTLTLDELKAKFELANETCQRCNRHINRQFLVPDHIIDMSFGGSNSAANIRILCGLYNMHRKRIYLSREVIEQMKGKYITTQEAATELAKLRGHDQPYTVRWIQSLIDRGKIIAKKFGHDWMINETSLKAYAKRGGYHGAPPQSDYLTISQAADILGVTPSAIYGRIKSGTLKSSKSLLKMKQLLKRF